MGINKDQVEGRVKQATGKAQEVAGRVAGNPARQLKGKIKKGVGSAQADLGDAKERLKRTVKQGSGEQESGD
ncbi:MAG TPA: CsbD family protein [Steroidobacteraceae bacterium]|nr:CsbD family protein [Steroidobacteraceae bacterium]